MNENLVFCKECKHLARMHDSVFCPDKYTTYISKVDGIYTRTTPYTFDNVKYRHMCFKNFKFEEKTVVTPIEMQTINTPDSEDNIEDCLIKNANNDCKDFVHTEKIQRL